MFRNHLFFPGLTSFFLILPFRSIGVCATIAFSLLPLFSGLAQTLIIAPISEDYRVNAIEGQALVISGTSTGLEEGTEIVITIGGIITDQSATTNAQGAWASQPIDLSAHGLPEGPDIELKVVAEDDDDQITETAHFLYDITPPQLVSAVVENDSPDQLEVTFSEPLTISTFSGFEVTIGSGTNPLNIIEVETVLEEKVIFKVDPIFEKFNYRISYSNGSDAADLAGNPLEAFGPVYISNNTDVPAVQSLFRRGCYYKGISLGWEGDHVSFSNDYGIIIFGREGAPVEDQQLIDQDPASFVEGQRIEFADGTPGQGTHTFVVVNKNRFGIAPSERTYDIVLPSRSLDYYFQAVMYRTNPDGHVSYSEPVDIGPLRASYASNVKASAGDGSLTLTWEVPGPEDCLGNALIVGRENGLVEPMVQEGFLIGRETTNWPGNADWSARSDQNDMFDLLSPNVSSALGVTNNTNYLVFNDAFSHKQVTITGLNNEVTYSFRLFVSNEYLEFVNSRSWQIDVQGTPIAAPNALRNLQVVSATASEINLSWEKPSGVQGVDWSGVLVYAKENDDPQQTLSVDAPLDDGSGSLDDALGVYGLAPAENEAFIVGVSDTNDDGSLKVVGLKPDVNYQFRAYAYRVVEGQDNDVFSPGTDVVTAHSQGIANLEATPGNGTITLTWNNPDDHTATLGRTLIFARKGAEVSNELDQGNLNLLPDPGYGNHHDFSIAPEAYGLTGFGNDQDKQVYFGTENAAVISGLTNGDTYHFKVFTVGAEDKLTMSEGREINAIPSLDDDQAPRFLDLSAREVMPTSFEINVRLNEPGIVHYVVVNAGDPPPSLDQVMNGTGHDELPAMANGAMQIELPGVSYARWITFLQPMTGYDIHLVATDPFDNRSAVNSSLLNITTGAIDHTIGVNISPPDLSVCGGEEYTLLGDIIIGEEQPDNFGKGNNQSLILTLPDGFEFIPGEGAVLRHEGSDLESGISIDVSTKRITLTYNVLSESTLDQLTISQLKVAFVSEKDLLEIQTLQRLPEQGGNAIIRGDEPGSGRSHANLTGHLPPAPPTLQLSHQSYSFGTNPDSPGAGAFDLQMEAVPGATIRYFSSEEGPAQSALDGRESPGFWELFGGMLDSQAPNLDDGADVGDHTIYVAMEDDTHHCRSALVPVSIEIVPTLTLDPDQLIYTTISNPVRLVVAPMNANPPFSEEGVFSGIGISFADLGHPNGPGYYFYPSRSGQGSHTVSYTWTAGRHPKTVEQLITVGDVALYLDGLPESVSGLGACENDAGDPQLGEGLFRLTVPATTIDEIHGERGAEWFVSELQYSNSGVPLTRNSLQNPNEYEFIYSIHEQLANNQQSYKDEHLFLKILISNNKKTVEWRPQYTDIYPVPQVDFANLSQDPQGNTFCVYDDNLEVNGKISSYPYLTEVVTSQGIYEIRKAGTNDAFMPLQGSEANEINFINPLNTDPYEVENIAYLSDKLVSITLEAPADVSDFQLGETIMVYDAFWLENEGSFQIAQIDAANNTLIITNRSRTDGTFDELQDSPAQLLKDYSGTYEVRFTSDNSDDQAREEYGGQGCVNSISTEITILPMPLQPELAVSDQFFYCEGELIIRGFYSIKNATEDNGIFYQWWGDADNPNSPDALNPDGTISEPDHANNFEMSASDIMGSLRPPAGTYDFYLTQSHHRQPLVEGSDFAGCNSRESLLRIEVLPPPEAPNASLATSSAGEDQSMGDQSYFVYEYCESDLEEGIESINMDLSVVNGPAYYEWFYPDETPLDQDPLSDSGSIITIDNISASPAELGITAPGVHSFLVRQRDYGDLFEGCTGAFTTIDVVIHPEPAKPSGMPLVYSACSQSPDLRNTELLTPEIENVVYRWFDRDGNQVGHDITDQGENITFESIPDFSDFVEVPTTYTLFLRQVEFLDQDVAYTAGFAGCESVGTEVNVTIYPIEEKPQIGNFNDGVEGSGVDVQYSFCFGDLTAETEFFATSNYEGENDQRFDWYLSNPQRQFISPIAVSDPSGSVATASELRMSGVLGDVEFYFLITQNSDIAPLQEVDFEGCESPSTLMKVNIFNVPAFPTPSVNFVSLCEGESLGAISVMGENNPDPPLRFRWYADQALTTELTVSEDGSEILPGELVPDELSDLGDEVSNLGGTPPPGTYNFYVTQSTDIATENNSPDFRSDAFAGCESFSSQVVITVFPDAEEPLLNLVNNEVQICTVANTPEELAQDIPTISVLNRTPGVRFLWYDEETATSSGFDPWDESYIPLATTGFPDFDFTPEPASIRVGEELETGRNTFYAYRLENGNSEFDGCLSEPTIFNVYMLSIAPPPEVKLQPGEVMSDSQEYKFCEREDLSDIYFEAFGRGEAEFIWYADEEQTTEISRQKTVSYASLTGVTDLVPSNEFGAQPGQASIYVTQVTSGTCGSTLQKIDIEVEELPNPAIENLPNEICMAVLNGSALETETFPFNVTIDGAATTQGEISGPGVTVLGGGNAVFDPLAALGISDPLEQDEIKTVDISFTVQADRCDIRAEHTITINPVPTVDFGFPAGPIVDNEFCVDAGIIPLNASSYFVNPSNTAPGDGEFSTDKSNSGLSNTTAFLANLDTETAFQLSEGSTDHNITYTYTTDKGCVNAVTKPLALNPLPEVDIVQVSGCDGEPVSFTANVVSLAGGDLPLYYDWDFGITSGAEDEVRVERSNVAEFTYEGFSGSFVTTLSVESEKGCMSTVPPGSGQFNTSPQPATASVRIGEIPEPYFTYRGLCNENPFVFEAYPRNLEEGSIKEIVFDFGDNSRATISNESDTLKDERGEFTIAHTFRDGGIYEVRLQMMTNLGCYREYTRLVPVLPVITLTPDDPYIQDFEQITQLIAPHLGDQPDTLYTDGWVPDIRELDDKQLSGNYEGSTLSDKRHLNNTWQYGRVRGVDISAGANGSAQAWVTNLEGAFADRENSWLLTPCFDFSSLERPMVRFQKIIDMDSEKDGVVFQFSVDNGLSWSVIGNYQGESTGIDWYTAEGIQSNPGSQLTEITNQVGWAGNTNANSTWSEAVHKLDEIPLEGRENVVFRFALGSLSNNSAGSQTSDISNEGFGIDNFVIQDRKRKVLVEHFNGFLGANDQLISAIDQLNEVMEDTPIIDNSEVPVNQDDAILITYKTDIAGEDPIHQSNPADHGSRVLYYGVDDLPVTILNGATITVVGEDVNVVSTSPFSVNDFNKTSLLDPPVTLEMSMLSTEGNNISLSVNIVSNDEGFDPSDMENRLFVAIVEKTVEQHGVILKNVLRKLLPDGAGSAINPADNNIDPLNLSWQVRHVEDPDDLMAIAWIQHSQTKAIYQSASIDIGDLDDNLVTSVEDSNERIAVRVFPNPTSKNIFIEFGDRLERPVNYALYNQSGTSVRSGILSPEQDRPEIDISLLMDGLYILYLGNDQRNYGYFKVLVQP